MGVVISRERHSAVSKNDLKEVLIIKFREKPDDFKSEIYGETLDFIAQNDNNICCYHFKDNQELMTVVNDHTFTTVIYANDIPIDTALLLKGLGFVQILIGMRDDLVDISDIIIDPLIKRSNRFLVGTRYLLPSLVAKYGSSTLGDVLNISADIIEEDVNHNDAENELIEITKLYRKMEWDSDFFGCNVGYISCLRLTPNIKRHITDFIRREKIDLLEYLCNCHDRESVVMSEKNGFSFVDMRLTFDRFLDDNIEIIKPRPGFHLRKANEKDIKKLKVIATDIYKHSRYYFDENFDRSKVIQFYQNWVEKAVLGQFDHYTFVLCHEQDPIGFCSIRQNRSNSVSIGLFGLSSEYTGQGLGTYLLKQSIYALKEEGIKYVDVVTQGRNYEAQRLYQHCGFLTKKTELWYHKWYH